MCIFKKLLYRLASFYVFETIFLGSKYKFDEKYVYALFCLKILDAVRKCAGITSKVAFWWKTMKWIIQRKYNLFIIIMQYWTL